MRDRITAQIFESGGVAEVSSRPTPGAFVEFYGPRRAATIVVQALLANDPESPLLPKLVRGLLRQSSTGRWLNTQESAFALLALEAYRRTHETATPDYRARVWLDRRLVGERAFAGRRVEGLRLTVPIAQLGAAGSRPAITLAKQGPGSLFYRIALDVSSVHPFAPSLDRGFGVRRAYWPIDQAEDVRRDGEGIWHIKAGARVRVTVQIATPAERYHVGLSDWLPAGLEAVEHRAARDARRDGARLWPARSRCRGVPPQQSGQVGQVLPGLDALTTRIRVGDQCEHDRAARRPGRVLLLAPRRGRSHLRLQGPGDDPRLLHRPGLAGRGAVHARDLRGRSHRTRRRGVRLAGRSEQEGFAATSTRLPGRAALWAVGRRGIKAFAANGAWLSLARARGSGPRGRRFESSRPDQLHRYPRKGPARGPFDLGSSSDATRPVPTALRGGARRGSSRRPHGLRDGAVGELDAAGQDAAAHARPAEGAVDTLAEAVGFVRTAPAAHRDSSRARQLAIPA